MTSLSEYSFKFRSHLFSVGSLSWSILLPFVLSFRHSNFSFLLFRLNCRPALMFYRSSWFLRLSPPLHPHPSLATWYGCQFIDGCVRQSHDSCFYSESLPYKPTAILGYWTNKLWASRKSISYIDKHRHTHECMHAHTMKCRWRQSFSWTHEYKRAQSKQQTLNGKHTLKTSKHTQSLNPLALSTNVN